MLQARFGPGLGRLAIASAVALVAAVAVMSVGVSESQAAKWALSGGCEIHENFCTSPGGGSGGGGDGAPSGDGWGVPGSGGGTDGGSTDPYNPEGGSSDPYWPDLGPGTVCYEIVDGEVFPVPCDPIEDGFVDPRDEFPKEPEPGG
jgi:hypothetical protein